MTWLKHWLAHPLTRDLGLDDPRTTRLRRRILQEKPFVRKVYAEWYAGVVQALPPGTGAVVELGAGAGFLADYLPGLITTEVFFLPGVRAVLDAQRLPFAAGTLRAVVMTDVLHHLPNVRAFFREAARCVWPGGRVVMVEPWVTNWSRWVYTHLHHEPFEPEVCEWEFPASGPLSGANGALPWMVFARDRAQFEREFPEWRILRTDLLMAFTYLASGGISMRSLSPGWSYAAWRTLERCFKPWLAHWAMFAQIDLERK
jgi:SAM-dependent methyltransferase